MKDVEDNIAEQQHQLRLCVAGAGAIGITLATKLAAQYPNVSILARGRTLADIREKGIALTDRDGHRALEVPVASAEGLGIQDVVFLCPKAQDLPQLAKDIQPLLHEGTLIVPVVNGIPWWYFEGAGASHRPHDIHAVDPGRELKALLPSACVIGCVTMFTAARISRSEAVAMNGVKLVLGEIDNQDKPRSHELGALLNACGIETRVSERIRDPLWTKVIANLMSNPLSVVAETHLRDLCGLEPLSRVVKQLLNEALLVAASYGARLELDPESLMKFAAGMGEVKTSMLQDYESGLPLELGAICDAVIELGDIRGLDMPLTRTITAIARYKSDAAMRAAA